MTKDDNNLMLDNLTEEQMKEIAAEGYFVRDIANDRVYCPMGEILRKKSNRKNGDTRYVNKRVCKLCEKRKRCTKSPWKEIDIPDKIVKVRNLNWLRANKIDAAQEEQDAQEEQE